MGKRRNSEVELCFDSMTDLITNLAGGLVLVVLLLVGLTRESPPTPEPPAAAAGKPKEGERSPAELYRRVVLLRAAVAQADGDIEQDRAELKKLDERVGAMLAQPKAADPPPKE